MCEPFKLLNIYDIYNQSVQEKFHEPFITINLVILLCVIKIIGISLKYNFILIFPFYVGDQNKFSCEDKS